MTHCLLGMQRYVGSLNIKGVVTMATWIRVQREYGTAMWLQKYTTTSTAIIFVTNILRKFYTVSASVFLIIHFRHNLGV